MDRRELADRLHRLGTAETGPGAVYTVADHMPGLSSGDALYEYGVALALALSDLADEIESGGLAGRDSEPES